MPLASTIKAPFLKTYEEKNLFILILEIRADLILLK